MVCILGSVGVTVAWYMVAYFGVRQLQREDCALRNDPMTTFWLWLVSPFPVIAAVVLWAAIRRACRPVARLPDGLAARLFPRIENK
jgi:hypothetical protein